MKKLLALLTHRLVITGIGLLAFSLLIWLGGPLVRFGESNYAPLAASSTRLTIILLAWAIWGLVELILFLLQRKKNQAMLEDISQQPEDSQADQSAEEIRQLKERFAEALEALKKTRFQSSSSNGRWQAKQKRALYELPWYIIIGPPGSGKTTALVNSGLDFPLAEKYGKNALQGVGGTRNCDWWFTNEAVLIDTAGRYTTQDSHRVVDSAAWQGFLKLLKNHRARQPINGVIVAVSVQDLALLPEQDRQAHAQTIRNRIEELKQQLGVNFPVYMLFTKCDLLAGFSEYFDDYGQDQREQIWGATFPLAESQSRGFDEQAFAEQFDELVQRITSRILWRMQSERDLKRRGLVQQFPQQLESLRQPIVDFLRLAFGENRYTEAALLRGVYLSSATQEGTPIDRIMSAVAGNLGLSRDLAYMPQGQGKSFFIEKLFRQVIFHEADLVGIDRRYERMLRWLRRATFIGLGVLALALVSVWTATFSRNQLFIADVERHLQSFVELQSQLNPLDQNLSAVLPALNQLRRASQVYEQEQHPWLVGMGLYDPKVDRAAKAAYHSQLQTLFLPRFANQLENQLNRSGAADAQLIPSLKAYLMLADPLRRDAAELLQWGQNQWSEQFPGQGSKQKQLLNHLQTLTALDFPAYQVRNEVVSRSQAIAQQISPAQRIYNSLRNDPQFAQPIDVSSAVGGLGAGIFVSASGRQNPYMMPIIFTKQGYQAVDLSQDSNAVQNVIRDGWVIGNSDFADLSDDELAAVSERAKTLYLKEYAYAWQNFLADLRIASMADLSQAASRVGSLADPLQSPLVSLLEIVKENTQLTAEPKLPGQEGEGKTAQLAAGLSALVYRPTLVDKQFKPLRDLVVVNPSGLARISASLLLVKNLQTYLNEISLAADPGEAAYQAARKRFGGGADALKSLRIEAVTLPKDVEGWLLAVSDNSWRLVLAAAKQYLDAAWREQVAMPFQRGLAGRYPLQASSNNQLALLDFAEFFKPGGVEQQFAENYLKPFINQTQNWQSKQVDGRDLGIASESLEQLRRAETIRAMFFRLNPASPGGRFSFKPLSLDASVRRFELDINGQRLQYTHGPKLSRNLTWPGDQDRQRVALLFEDLNGNKHRQQYNGPWGFFKLLDNARLRATNRGNRYRVRFSESGRKAEYEIVAKSVNNPLRIQELRAYKCPTSL